MHHISFHLKRYHSFHAERDFNNIIRWLGGAVPATSRSSIPHNLPTLQPFFGREDELRMIADALDPDSRTWGALIDGPGGMGKTSLAVRAAYAASPDVFTKIIFISLKARELDDDGLRDLSGFLVSGIVELFGELARELGCPEIVRKPESLRPRLLLNALRGTQTLLVLDNLESLTKPERDTLFTFVKKLPTGCKAILTSRGRIGSGAEELILEKLGSEAALATLAELATHNSHLAQTSEAERLMLYSETAGKPLLLRWTAGQLGRGHCLTFTDALNFIRSWPEGNDPLEFIFGDLIGDFDEAETQALCALTYFTLPAKVEHIAAIAGLPEPDTDRALRKLAVRSLAVPTDELETFTLVPMVADFLRKKKPQSVAEMGHRLETCAYDLVLANGYRKHDHFPVLDNAWPIVAAALPRFLVRSSEDIQTVCAALQFFLNFTGRWDERLALCRMAEKRALECADLVNAGWRACQAGWVHHRRGQSTELLACSDRADKYWQNAEVTAIERATALHLRGHVYRILGDHIAALKAYRQAVEYYSVGGRETMEVARGLNALANCERLFGDLEVAERDFEEALRIARKVDDREGIAYITGNLAALALDRCDWVGAETVAREALPLSERLGRQELIASNCYRLAVALARQEREKASLVHTRRAVEIYTRLGSPDLADAQALLIECEAAVAGA